MNVHESASEMPRRPPEVVTGEVSVRRMPQIEKRKFRRVEMDVPIEIELLKSNGVFNGRLLDMSTGGIRIGIPEATARQITGPIYVNLPVGSRRYRVEVEAIRHDAGGLAARYVNTDPRMASMICRHVFTELRRAQSITVR